MNFDPIRVRPCTDLDDKQGCALRGVQDLKLNLSRAHWLATSLLGSETRSRKAITAAVISFLHSHTVTSGEKDSKRQTLEGGDTCLSLSHALTPLATRVIVKEGQKS